MGILMTNKKTSVIESKLENFLYKEQKIVDDLLSQFFGYYLIHFNKYNCLDTSISKISNQINYSDLVKIGTDISGDSNNLPFNSDSIDFVLMPHFLEFSKKPDKIISEVHRILRGEGGFLITGFNKHRVNSGVLLSLLSKKSGIEENKIKLSDISSASSQVELLKKQGFEIINIKNFALFLPSVNNPKDKSWGYNFITNSLGVPSFFCFGYVILAKKKVAEILPLKPKWSRVHRSVGSGIIKKRTPAQNNIKTK